jgi:HlyD family secretion protein
MDRPLITPGADMDRRIAPSRWRKLAPWGFGAAAVLVAALAYALIAPGSNAKGVKASDLQIAAVRRAPFHDFVPARAEVAPLQTVFLDAVEGGQVARVVAANGDAVAAGDLIAVLSNPQLEREVSAREADISGRISDVRGQLLQLQRSRADRQREVEQARYELLQTERNLKIRQGLHAKGFVSDAELAAIEDEGRFRRNKLTSLEAAVRQEGAVAARQGQEIQRTLMELQGNLGAVKRSLEALNVRAPVAGRLTAFDLQPGQTVQAGARIGQVDAEGAYKLIARIDEFYLGRLDVGQAGVARHADRDYALRVSRILPQVQNGVFQVEMEFASALPQGVRRGQTIDAQVTLGDTRPALVLPNGPFLEATGGNWAFVLNASGRTAERRTIKTGRRNPQEVEVLSGLKPGERVVTSAYDGFDKQNRLILR